MVDVYKRQQYCGVTDGDRVSKSLVLQALKMATNGVVETT